MDIQIYGADADTLKTASEALKTAVAQFSEVSAVEDNLAYDKEELVLELTPQGRSLGFTIDDIGRELRNRLNGIEAATFPDGVRTATVTVRLPENELTADFLQKTRLRTASGTYVPLADIVSIETTLGFSTVRRENGIRLISVTGDISEDNAERATFIEDQLRTVIMPKIASDLGIEWRMSGLAEQEEQFLSDAFLGFSLCMLGIYLTLTWIFASWTRPLVVMAVIPFGMIGTIYGHHAWDVPLSIFSVVGLIGMSGIIINDSIVLVTTVDEYSKTRGLFPAIVDAATDRLRPVLLTTLTTVLGLTPLLYEGSRQAEFLKPTVITLCYGLGVGLFIVLLVVPSLLIVQKDVGSLFTSYRRATLGHHKAIGQKIILLITSAAALVLLVATVGVRIATDAAPAWITSLQIRPLTTMSATMQSLTVLSLGLILTLLIALFSAVIVNWRSNSYKT
jgi:multidrug efflux pump subunit AcrB